MRQDFQWQFKFITAPAVVNRILTFPARE